MHLVLDANILFSVLIKNSYTADLFFKNLTLYSPDFLIEEFLKYEDLLLNKTHISREDYIKTLHLLNDIVITVPKEDFLSFIDLAKKISPDKKDVLYLALALKLNCPIWSNDKRLKQQDEVLVYSTEELKKII